ncbi:MAG TPA: pyridoxamine 5'-phosphate oxidase family protein [Streptosporangiales bacterium]
MTAQAAERVLSGTRYVVLSTADEDGRPWATPVWFAREGRTRFYWVSRPGTRHSRNIAGRGDVALVVFDSQVPVGEASAFYARARAAELPAEEVAAGMAIFSREAEAQGIGAWDVGRVTGDAPLRLYRATVTEEWVLSEDDGPDRRLPLAR